MKGALQISALVRNSFRLYFVEDYDKLIKNMLLCALLCKWAVFDRKWGTK